MGDIAISVIIPIYNSEKYIKECVESILCDDFSSVEILLVDDGSKDNSFKICKELEKTDDRIKAFHKANGGICDARNFGLKEAKGEYIMFADHDDIVYKGFLNDNYKYAKEIGADMVKFGRDVYIINSMGTHFGNTRKFRKRTLKTEDIKDGFYKLRRNSSLNCVWDAIFKRDLIMNNNISFNTGFKSGGEDLDFCSRCISKSSVVGFSDGVYYKHIVRVGYSTSTKLDDNKSAKYELLLKSIDDCMDNLNIPKENNYSYFSLIVAQAILPAIVFKLKKEYKYSEFKKYFNDNFSKHQKYAPSFNYLLTHLNKENIFAFLFKFNLTFPIYLIYNRKDRR